MANAATAEATGLEGKLKAEVIRKGDPAEMFKYFVLSPKLLIATGMATAIFGTGMGAGTYLTWQGDAVKIQAQTQAETQRYIAIQEITKQYAGQMSPEAFKQYLKELGLVEQK